MDLAAQHGMKFVLLPRPRLQVRRGDERTGSCYANNATHCKTKDQDALPFRAPTLSDNKELPFETYEQGKAM